MKTFLIALGVLSSLNCFYSAPQPELTDDTFPSSPTENCEVDFNKLEREIGDIKKILEERFGGNPTVTETPSTNDATSKQIKSDIQEINKKMTTLLGSSPNENIFDLINANKEFVDKKLLSLKTDIEELIDNFNEQKRATKRTTEKHETMIVDISTNVNQTFEKFTEQQTKINLFMESNADFSKKFEEFNAEVTKLLNTKFQHLEIELTTLDAQNKQYLEELKRLNDQLDQQTPQLKEHADKIEKTVAEKHEELKNHMESMNATLAEHFVKHAEKLNGHESSLKDIKESIAKLETKFGAECTKSDSYKELIQSLVTRFDKAEPYWKKLESFDDPDKKCSQEAGDIDLHIILDE